MNRATEFTIQNNTIKTCQQRMEVKTGIKMFTRVITGRLQQFILTRKKSKLLL